MTTKSRRFESDQLIHTATAFRVCTSYSPALRIANGSTRVVSLSTDTAFPHPPTWRVDTHDLVVLSLLDFPISLWIVMVCCRCVGFRRVVWLGLTTGRFLHVWTRGSRIGGVVRSIGGLCASFDSAVLNSCNLTLAENDRSLQWLPFSTPIFLTFALLLVGISGGFLNAMTMAVRRGIGKEILHLARASRRLGHGARVAWRQV